MKRIIAIIALALFAGQIVAAQEKNDTRDRKNEISFSYGAGSFNHLMGTMLGISNLHGSDFGYDTHNVNSTSSGAFNLEYLRYLGDLEIWAAGVSTSYEHTKSAITLKENAMNVGSVYFDFISIMAEVKHRWAEWPHVAMYYKLGVGVSFMINKEENEKGTKTLPAFQLNPACVEFGGEAFKGFLELGWGSQSLSQLGVRYCF